MPRGCGGVIASKGVVYPELSDMCVPLNSSPKDAVYRDYWKCCRNRPQWRRSRSGANIYCDSALLTTEIEICQGLRNSNRQNGTAQPYKKEKEEKDLNPWWKMIQISLRIVQGPRSSQSAISVKHSSMYNRLPFIFISRTIWSSAQASRIMILIPVLIQRSMHGIILILTQIVLHTSHFILTDGPRRWDMRVIITSFLASHCFPSWENQQDKYWGFYHKY